MVLKRLLLDIKEGVSMKAIQTLLQSLGYEHWALIVLFLSIFIDVTPAIKLNPIKSLFKYLGKAFNSSLEIEIGTFKQEVNEKFDELQREQLAQRETLDRIILDNSNKEIGRLRWEIIDFENSIRNGNTYPREKYKRILDLLDKYNSIMMMDDAPLDDYYRTVQEAGESIRHHYEEYTNNSTLRFF